MTIRNRFMKVLSSFFGISTSFRLIAAITLVLGLNACYNEPNLLGGDLIPSDDKSLVQTTDTFAVAAYTVKTDTLVTTGFTIGVLGNVNNNVFGKLKAGFYSRIEPYDEKDTLATLTPTNRPDADSIILKLRLVRNWGGPNKSINIRVYRISEKIDSSKLYNGLTDFVQTYNATQVNEETIYSGEDTLNIKFKDDFAKIIYDADASVLGTKATFMNLMKGLYITADELVDPIGVLYSFDISRSSIVMYYKKSLPSGTQKLYYLTFSPIRFNSFQHTYTNVDPAIKSLSANDITDNTPQDTVFGINGMGGVKGLFKFKSLKEWKKKMPIVIHRAELRFDVLDHSVDSSMKGLYFYNYRDYTLYNNKIVNVFDIPILDNVFVAGYNRAKTYYSLDVTIQLQKMIASKIPNEYIIVENKNYQNTYMQGLYRTSNNSNPIKLVVTYSKL